MKFILSQLHEGKSQPVTQNYDPVALELNQVDFQYLGQVRMEGSAEKNLDVLTFRGSLTAQIEQTCARCLKTQTSTITKPFELFFDIKDKSEIEALDELREILIMDHPLTFLCSENCQGLCPQCGTNLNEKKCKCQLTNRTESLSSWQIAMKKKYGGNQ